MVNKNGIRVLIAEDEPITAMDFKRVVQDIGCKVIGVVNSGEDLIEHILKEIPSLIISDINLKGELDGIEAISRIREMHDIPFIYVTAYKDFERVVEIYNLKPCRYILKPVESGELKKIINECIDEYKIKGA